MRRLKLPAAIVAGALTLLATSRAGLAAQVPRPSCFDTARSEAERERPQSPGQFLPKAVGQIRARVEELLSRVADRPDPRDRAFGYCTIAELMKRVGDTRAMESYEKAIQTDGDVAEYSLLYGDYLRTFRGPEEPLFAAAEAAYREALGKAAGDPETGAKVERSLIALYERDGLPLLGRIDRGTPHLFFSTQNTVGRLVNDIGEVDDMRDAAVDALVAGSRERLNRTLSPPELRGLVHAGSRVDTLHRVRVRSGKWPVIDGFVGYRALGSRQITSYFEPNQFSDVRVSTVGVAVAKPFSAYPVFDVVLRGKVHRSNREGLVEFLPDAKELATSVVAQAVFSRFVGPDKVNIEIAAVSESIDQQVAQPIRRHVVLAAPTVRYQLFRRTFRSAPFERPIAPRGSELFVGALYRKEAFGPSDIVSRDFFGGVSLKGVAGFREGQSFDLTVQPTLFSSERSVNGRVPPVDALRSRQYCTFVTWLYRLVDRENERDVRHLPPLVFVNLVVAGGHGVGLEGPNEFGMIRAGGGVDVKLVSRALQGGTTLLVSGRYELHRYARLGRREHLAFVNLSMGF